MSDKHANDHFELILSMILEESDIDINMIGKRRKNSIDSIKKFEKKSKMKKTFFSDEKILGFLYNSVETYRIRLNFCFPLDNNYLRYLNMFRAQL